MKAGNILGTCCCRLSLLIMFSCHAIWLKAELLLQVLLAAEEAHPQLQGRVLLMLLLAAACIAQGRTMEVGRQIPVNCFLLLHQGAWLTWQSCVKALMPPANTAVPCLCKARCE